MTTAMRSAATALLVIGCSLGTAAQAACRYVNIGTMEVDTGRGAPTVAGRVNDLPVRAQIGTGSTITRLSQATAERARLALGHTRYEIYNAEGTAQAYRALVDEISFGPLQSRRTGIAVASQDQVIQNPKRRTEDADAELGADVLMQADLELALADRKLRFFRPDGCEADAFLAYWDAEAAVLPLPSRGPEDRRAVFEVLLNGKPVRAMISTASRVSHVDQATAVRVGLAVPEHADSHWVGRFDRIEIGGVAVQNAQVLVKDRWKDFPQEARNWDLADSIKGQPGMILGMDFLASHRVLVAPSQRRIYLSYLGGAIFSTELPR